jgi:hypothetical protein
MTSALPLEALWLPQSALTHPRGEICARLVVCVKFPSSSISPTYPLLIPSLSIWQHYIYVATMSGDGLGHSFRAINVGQNGRAHLGDVYHASRLAPTAPDAAEI